MRITRVKIAMAKLLYRLTVLFTGPDKRIIIRRGIGYEVDPSEGLDLSMLLFGNFQRHVSRNPWVKIPQQGMILDVGANVGFMTLQYAQLVPGGLVYAFEPTGYAYAKLLRNLSLNPELEKTVRPVQAFLSSGGEADAVPVAYSSWRVDGSSRDGRHPVHWGSPMPAGEVPVITLDAFCAAERLERIDFIKIDTDGHEYAVLSGAIDILRRFRPAVILEIGLYIMEERGLNFGDYDRFFTGLGYELYDAANLKPVTTGNHLRRIPRWGTIDLLALPAAEGGESGN